MVIGLGVVVVYMVVVVLLAVLLAGTHHFVVVDFGNGTQEHVDFHMGGHIS